jgi:hypothetical protein
MKNFCKCVKHLDQLVFIGVIGLQLIKTLIIPNAIDILILIGLVIVFVVWFADYCD